MVANKTLKNLYVDIQGSGIRAKPGQTSLNRIITVSNRGNRAASIELWLEPVDERSSVLRQWTDFDVAVTDLRLEAGDEKDVRLTFRIPPQAKHGFYSYSIRAHSDQYPGEEVRRSQQLQILPSNQELELRNKPNITIEPYTDSETPYELSAGSTLNITVTITNPSRRTDLFLLSCSDLNSAWYDIKYPEQKNRLPGIIRQTEGLELNPKETGEIVLSIHPPQYAPAGNYFPTIQIHSNNRKEELTILEIVYLKILVSSHLDVRLTPNIKKLKKISKKEYFELAIFNFGNIKRHLQLESKDIDKNFKYKIEPNSKLELHPGEEKKIQIHPYPASWRRRYLFRLQELKATFEVELQNVWSSSSNPSKNSISDANEAQIFLEQIQTQEQWLVPELPEKPETATIILEARRGWLWKLVLTILFTALGLGILFGVWKYLFWKPSLEPRIINFEPAKAEYQEEVDEEIKFNFEITNFDQVSSLALYRGQQEQVEIERLVANPKELQNSPLRDFLFIYQFNRPTANIDPELLPPEESDSNDGCTLIDSTENNGLLQPLFNLYRGIVSKKTEETTSEKKQILRCINISFKVMPDTGDVFLQTTELKPEDKKFQKGEYSFSLMTFKHPRDSAALAEEETTQRKSINASDLQLADMAFIKKVEVAPPPPPAPPEILEFSALASEYRLLGEGETSTLISAPAPSSSVVDENTQSSKVTEVSSSQDDSGNEMSGEQSESDLSTFDSTQAVDSNVNLNQSSIVPIRLSWEVSNATDITELKLVSVSPEGVENIQTTTYDNFRWDPEQGDRLDADLEPYCERNNLNQLICRSVPIQVDKAGEYTFTLTVATNRDDVTEEITAQTSTIIVKEPSPKIINFMVNGEKVLEKPKFVYPVSLGRVSFEIELTWDVLDTSQVELLPAPGVVTNGGLIYIISAAPGSETLTLRATNKAGEKVERSVVIEKVEFTSLPEEEQNSNNPNLLPPPPPPLINPDQPEQFPTYQSEPKTN